MSASDHLGPQFGSFDASGPHYGGSDSEFRYSRESKDLQVTKNSRGMANMLGKNRSEDLGYRIPTGATTDFQSKGSDFSARFLPARIPESGSGRNN